ncbi:MAG TPA: S46 family peptidase [Bryobacteraceae bacterium]|nr:S46 family peptidase [Bryobacteraceae bacterium]
MNSRIAAPLIALGLAGAVLTPILADEGMWTFDNPPVKLIQQKYGFTLTRQWLDHVRLASARLNDGGSGSFISPHGLLLTNHHVASGQLTKDSTPEHDYIKNAFYARTQSEELKAPDLEVDVLMSTEDVTARVQAAVKNAKTPEQQGDERRKIIAEIERDSLQKTGLRSEVVTLYQGGEYWLYRYKEYTDIRIVFAPEQQAAFFGGDDDNFTYPRYDLDMAIFRVYENGKPIDSTNYLKWNPKGPSNGDLLFVSGNPGSTERLDTVSQLEYQRDQLLPLELVLLHDRYDVLKSFSQRGDAEAVETTDDLLRDSNSIKALAGMLDGLKEKRIMDTKRGDEGKFRAAVLKNPELKANYGNAWNDIAEAERKAATRTKERFFHSTDSQLASFAATIVDYVAEIKKPDGERLPGFHDADLKSLQFQLFSPAPVYKDMEIARMTGALALDLKQMGAKDPFVKIALDGKTPAQAAQYYVSGTHLNDPAVRKKLIEGGQAAVDASADPMIVLERKLDPMRRESIRWWQDNVESVLDRGGEELGRARFAIYGRNTYPDATFTLRLSYGQMKGYPMNGTIAPPMTTFYGLYGRSADFSNSGEFYLIPRFAENRDKLHLATPFNIVTTNDIIGGNSGSPVIDKDGSIVGLIFDGNIESLVGDYVYDIETNRAVAVDTAAMTEALEKLYGAGDLLKEIMGQ